MTENNMQENDFIFSKISGGNSVSRVAVNKMFKKFVGKYLSHEECYTSKAHCHTIRHTRAIQLLNSGVVNLKKLQYILGHSNIVNTVIYLQYVNMDIRKSVLEANKQLGLV